MTLHSARISGIGYTSNEAITNRYETIKMFRNGAKFKCSFAFLMTFSSRTRQHTELTKRANFDT